MAFQRHLIALLLASLVATPAAFAAPAPATPEAKPSLGQCLRQDPETRSAYCVRQIELAEWRAALADNQSSGGKKKASLPEIIIPPGYIPQGGYQFPPKP